MIKVEFHFLPRKKEEMYRHLKIHKLSRESLDLFMKTELFLGDLDEEYAYFKLGKNSYSVRRDFISCTNIFPSSSKKEEYKQKVKELYESSF